MRPFGCPVTILNTIDHLGKFDGKADEGFFGGYSLNSKAFRVFNSRTRIVEENLHIRFSENTPKVVGSGTDWLFDIDAQTRTINYEPIVTGTRSNGFAGTKANENASQARKETEPVKDYILLPLWTTDTPFSQDPKSSKEKEDNVNSTNNVNAASTNEVNVVGGKTSIELTDDPNMPALEDIIIFDSSRDDEDDGGEVNMNNLDTTIQVSPNPTTRIHKDHPLDQVIGDLKSATQTRRMSKNLEEHGFVSTIKQRTNHKDLQNCLFASFLSQEPKKVIYALKDPNWIEAMQEELLQFKLQEVWTLVDLPNGKRAIGTKWGTHKRIDYDEFFAPVARIKAIRLFLAYDSFKDFVVYQMDVKSAFLYGKIEEEVYVCQPPGFEDPDFPDRVYKVEKAMYGLHQAPRAWHKGDILLVQVYVDDIIFGSSKKELCNTFEKFTDVKNASTPMETQKPLLKDEDGKEVDVHMYRSMIGSLMYLTSLRPDIMFAVCACARYQVNPKVSHLHAVKRIFMYLKCQPKLGLWYPKDSPFDLIAYTDSDYAGASLDRKSTIGDCQFFGCRLISWQCKKQTVAANSTTEAEYVAASSCCGQVLWIQNQLLDYGDCNEKKLIQMIRIHTDKNIADLLTKAFDAKTVNGEVQLQALVDGKKIIITESIVRRDLQLEDAEGVDCLPNATIFGQLTLMGSKTTAWNEFSSTMASAIICLTTNQKFNFSKYIFESMVKILDNVSKFLIYPWFVQVFLDKQLEGMASHDKIYSAPFHTKKVTANMRRVGKDFSGRETPLFPTMVVQHQEEMGEDEAVNEEMNDSLERAATTTTSLDAEQDRGDINKTQSKATLNEPSSPGTSSGSGPRHQETMGDTIAQTRFENISKTSNDPMLARGNTLRSGEDSMKLNELTELCTNLQQRVLDLETTKTTQATEIASLKRRVKKLERRNKSRTHGLKRLYKETRSVVEEVTAITIPVSAATTITTTTAITDVEMNLAQALAELKSTKPKADKVVIQEPEQGTPTLTTTTAATTITVVSTRPRAKGIVIHEQEQAPTPIVSSQQPSQEVQDKELAFKLQAEEEEEERLAREKDQKVKEANIAWDNVQAKIEANYQLAKRLQDEE
ncbi:putative ribonuclease H-like domain-containing protein [Tanacetum coccineum]|uniref:Ribonuclease H-like domain-containing protein n=1 Tax=Tanacetum coccineum TaxID=301880 RepID=A0ABQ4WY81_9ASTR